MSLSTELHGMLGPLVSGRAYTDSTPKNPTYPLIVYQAIGGDAYDYVEKALPSKDNARVQVLVWSKTRAEAESLARLARQTIITATWASETIGAATSLHEQDLGLYGSRQDFGVWHEP